MLGFLLLCKTPLHSQSDFTDTSYFQLLLAIEYQKANQLTSVSGKDLLHQQAHSLSQILYKSGQIAHQQLPLLDKDTPKETKVINLLQYGYYNLYYRPNEPETLKYFFEAYILSKNIKNDHFLKFSLLAVLEFYHFEYAQTHTRYKKYLKEFELLAQTPIEKCWAHLYRLYFLYQSIADVDEQAINEEFQKLEKELLQLPEDHTFFVLYNSIKAIQLEFNGNLEEALKKHSFVLEFSKDKPYLNYLAFRSFIRISEIYYKKEEYQKGLQAMKEARFFIDKSNTLKDSVYITKYTSKHYEALGDYKKAYTLLNKSVEDQYTLDYKNNCIQNSSLEIELQTADTEKQLLLSEQQEKQNRDIAIGLGGGILAVTLIGFLLFVNTKRKQRIAEQQRMLEVQKTETLLKDQELNTIDAMLLGQEKERQRLANDLHDSVGATLAAAKLQFHHLSQNRDKKDGSMEELFQKTGQLLDHAYSEVRNMAHVKNNGVIAKNGLLPAIQKLAKSASNVHGLSIEVEDYGLDKRLDNALEIAIFRIVQELVTNIMKHAQATKASIAINQYEDTFNLIVEDNGRGFDARHLPQKEGMGLASIEKRVEHLEGSMEVDSTLGKGTHILIDIPL
jgi:signal transduction histidine kinase